MQDADSTFDLIVCSSGSSGTHWAKSIANRRCTELRIQQFAAIAGVVDVFSCRATRGLHPVFQLKPPSEAIVHSND